MELSISTPEGKQGAIKVSDVAFAREFNQDLVHQVVVAYQSGGRQGSKAQKNRSAVAGGGKKPWRQKGTGRARAGTIRSPIWRGGGVTFAAQPREYNQKVNKKMYCAALKCIFSELARQGRLIILEDLNLPEPKTKELLKLLGSYNVASNVLIIVQELEKNLYLASRNIRELHLIDANSIDPVSLIGHQKVVVTVAAIKKIEEVLK